MRDAALWMSEVIGPDYGYVRIGIVYTVAITLLSLEIGRASCRERV